MMKMHGIFESIFSSLFWGVILSVAPYFMAAISGITLVAFVILKLVETISWSWWWVTSPLWIGAVATAFIALFCFWLIRRDTYNL